MRRSLTAVLLSGTLLLAASAAAQDIDTGTQQFRSGNGLGSDYIGWGQSFTTPAAERFLNSFAFDLGDVASDFSFYSYIYQWDGSKKGSVVWSGGLHSLTGAHDGYFQVNTGGLGLTANGVYLAFLESDRPRMGYAKGTTKTGFMANTYAGGSMVADNGTFMIVRDGGGFVDANGTRHGANQDAAFRADFSAQGPLLEQGTTVTPEPVSMALLGTGLAGIAGVARRRRRKAEEASA